MVGKALIQNPTQNLKETVIPIYNGEFLSIP